MKIFFYKAIKFEKPKKTQKNPLFGEKPNKTQKNPVPAGFFKKTQYFANPGLDLCFHNPNQFLRGAPDNHPEINKKKLGQVTYQRKAFRKLFKYAY